MPRWMGNVPFILCTKNVGSYISSILHICQFGRILGRILCLLKFWRKPGREYLLIQLVGEYYIILGNATVFLIFALGTYDLGVCLGFASGYTSYFVLKDLTLDLTCVWLRYFIADTLKQLLTSPAASTCHGPQWFKCSLLIKSIFTTIHRLCALFFLSFDMTSSPYTTLPSLGGMLLQ